MTKFYFHVRSWSDYAFYALREGTSDKMNDVFKKLRNVDCVLSPKLESCSVYPNFSREGLSMNVFNDIISSPHPIVCNWPTIIIKHALNMDRNPDNYAHGYSQESNVDEGYNYFDDVVVSKVVSSPHIPNVMVEDKQTSNPLYHHLNTFVKDISMYVKDEDVSMRNYVTEKMCSILKDCMLYSDGKFDPLSFQASEQVDMVRHEYDKNKKTFSSDEELVELSKDAICDDDVIKTNVLFEPVGNVITSFPSTDTRNKDKRIKYAHER